MIYKLLGIVYFSSFPYLFSLHGDFVFDDSEAIVKNKDVFNNSWVDSFSNDFWGTDIKSNLSHKSYRPLTILSFRLNYLLSGQKLIPYHFKILNLICHVFCSILVWQAFSKLIPNKKQRLWLDEAYLAAQLFSVHPIHVEAVSGIVGRADILAGITFFLAFLAYHKSVTTTSRIRFLYFLLAVLISGISMLFKENGITVLGFCIIYEFATKFTIRIVDQSKKASLGLGADSIVRLSLATVAALCLLYARWTVMGSTKPEFKPIDNPTAYANSTFTRIMTFSYIYFLNIALLSWPQWLCYDWSMGCIPLIGSINDYRIFLVVLMYLYGLFMIRALISNRNRIETIRHIVLAISLMVIPFLPAANIFYPVGFVIAERVLYISSAGYCLLIIMGLNKIMRKKPISKIGKSLYFLLLLTFTLRSWQRSLEWRTEYLLFTSGLSVCPLNAKVRYNVAKVADANRNTEWALEEYRAAIRLYPEYYQAMNNLANLLKNLKQYDEAEFYLRKAISNKLDFPAAWMNLGIVLANTKRYNESQDAYKMALKYRHEYPDCYYNLGNLYLEMDQPQAAMDTWLEAIKMSPEHNLAWTNFLALLDNTGQLQKALQVIPKALKELPNSPSVNFAIANIYGKINRYEDAEQHFLRAIELFDKKVQAIHYANLGVLYHRWKKYSLAQEMYKKALAIDPKFQSASKNLESLFKRRKKYNGL